MAAAASCSRPLLSLILPLCSPAKPPFTTKSTIAESGIPTGRPWRASASLHTLRLLNYRQHSLDLPAAETLLEAVTSRWRELAVLSVPGDHQTVSRPSKTSTPASQAQKLGMFRSWPSADTFHHCAHQRRRLKAGSCHALQTPALRDITSR
jgi:hypothetical protein